MGKFIYLVFDLTIDTSFYNKTQNKTLKCLNLIGLKTC